MLEVTGLTKRFGGLVAVDNVFMHIKEGELVSLIGPNGAGKTTLFGMISGFTRPSAGSVSFRDKVVTKLKPHAICRLGVVRTFQIVQPFGALSVEENIAIGAHLHARSAAQASEQAREIAKFVGLDDRLGQPASDLTIAGRKRLELARALATKPRLLLLDEVMAGLTPTEIAEIVPIIRAIHQGGITVLLIEHVMQAVMALSERVYVLNQGRLIAVGKPQDVARDAQVVEAYLGHGAAARFTESVPA